MSRNVTRRRVLAVLPGGLLGAALASAQKSQPLPQAGEFVRFADPTTETPVVRLTSPTWRHVLPHAGNRFVTLKPRMLYCSSDRVGGRLQPFQVDLRTGAIRQLAETAALDPASLCLESEGRSLYFIEARRLNELPLSSRRDRTPQILADDIAAFSLGSTRSDLFAISGTRLLHLQPGGRSADLLSDQAIAPCLARPGHSGCLFARSRSESECEFWYAQPPAKPVKLVAGPISNPYWSADGESLLFLRAVAQNNALLAELREIKPEELVERTVSLTSQFAVFAANLNDSVFVGASSSRAQPNVVLLLRATRRELTLCEHRSSRPAEVRPAFSPDSRRVYFESDRDGKFAIYSVNVEHLIEPT